MRRKSKSEEVTGLRPMWVGPNGQKKKTEGHQMLMFTGGLIPTPWMGEAPGIHPADPPPFAPSEPQQLSEGVFL